MAKDMTLYQLILHTANSYFVPVSTAWPYDQSNDLGEGLTYLTFPNKHPEFEEPMYQGGMDRSTAEVEDSIIRGILSYAQHLEKTNHPQDYILATLPAQFAQKVKDNMNKVPVKELEPFSLEKRLLSA